jgi:hypothetical protein
MSIIDMNNWSLHFGGNSSSQRGLSAGANTPAIVFDTPLSLMRYLMNDDSNRNVVQNMVRQRLDSDPVADAWHEKRQLLRSIPYFRRWRLSKFESFHEAARAVAQNRNTVAQAKLVAGLNAEISKSQVVLPVGQVVFHGRCSSMAALNWNYSSFVSTSLDPIVAVNSALRRTQSGGVNRRPVVYILRVVAPVQVIWGNGGKLHEWELLMPTGLNFAVRSHYSGTFFDVMEADVG